MNPSLLIVDDDANVRASLQRRLANGPWHLSVAANARECLAIFDRERPTIVLLDLVLPELSGLELLAVLRERDPDVTVVMLTGEGDIASAVEAIRLGAENFLTKPASGDHLELALRRAFEKAELRERSRLFSERTSAPVDLSILGGSPAMRRTAKSVEVLAAQDSPVLLTGETGTGKGWIANLIHQRSRRAGAPFIEVNCGGLTATFLDSELFGHERGAFTDAKAKRFGLFELANGGTLFLDEIGDLALELQPKLLKVLESQRFRRLGGAQEVQVDVRVIAATNRDLAAELASRRFREDLYYRLAVLPVHLPPLRERGRDAIFELTHRILKDLRRTLGQGPSRVDPDALAAIAVYAWPGNIRELRNVLERVVLLSAHEEVLRRESLPLEISRAQNLRFELPREEQLVGDLTLHAAEQRHVQRVLALCGGNRTRAAEALGIARATLYKFLSHDAQG